MLLLVYMFLSGAGTCLSIHMHQLWDTRIALHPVRICLPACCLRRNGALAGSSPEWAAA